MSAVYGEGDAARAYATLVEEPEGKRNCLGDRQPRLVVQISHNGELEQGVLGNGSAHALGFSNHT
jgi:hypothetical protein